MANVRDRTQTHKNEVSISFLVHAETLFACNTQSNFFLSLFVSSQPRVVYMLCQGGKKRSECFHLFIFVYHNYNRKQDNTLRGHKSQKNSDTRTTDKNRYFLK